MPEEEIPTAIYLTSQALLESTPYPTQPQDNSPTSNPAGPEITPDPAKSTESADQTPLTQEPPTPILVTPSLTATYALEDLSPGSLPDSLPYGTIQILNPGSLSKIISPIRLHAYLHPGTDGKVRVILYGEDGRVLVQRIIRYDAPPKTKVYLKLDLRFEIPGVAETGRLAITTRDEYGRVIALASTDVILLTKGDTDINPPTDLYEKIVIEEPLPDILIQGGKIIVKGYTRCVESDRLYVELVNYQGDVVGSEFVGISEKELGLGYHFYAGEVPYEVGSSGTWVRVQISALDDDLSGVLHTSSVRVLITP
ncbi:MAG: hypothetical protein R6U57_03990 [Anaerolineales bacterium]